VHLALTPAQLAVQPQVTVLHASLANIRRRWPVPAPTIALTVWLVNLST
jgi:predicted nucleic acid-binding Zn ribbon protein